MELIVRYHDMPALARWYTYGTSYYIGKINLIYVDIMTYNSFTTEKYVSVNL